MQKLILLGMGLMFVACSHINPVGDGKTHLVRCHSWLKNEDSCAKLADEVCTKGYKVLAKNTYWEMNKGPQRSVTVVCN